MVETRKGLVLYGVLFAIMFLGLVQVIRTTQNTTFFFLESLGLLFLLFLILLGFMGAGKRWGQNMFLAIFLFYVLNLVVGWWFLRGVFIGFLVVIAVFGLILGISQRNTKLVTKLSSQPSVQKPIVKDRDFVMESQGSKAEIVEETKIIKLKTVHKKTDKKTDTKPVKDNQIDQIEKKTSSISVKHSPGKFVASKNSNVFHVPKCEWAKKIAKIRQLWFATKEEAWEKGYKSHNCVQ